MAGRDAYPPLLLLTARRSIGAVLLAVRRQNGERVRMRADRAWGLPLGAEACQWARAPERSPHGHDNVDVGKSATFITGRGQEIPGLNHEAEREMDGVVDDLVDELVAKLKALSGDAYFREAIMKAAIRRLCHRVVSELEVYPDEVADQLDLMADVLREGARTKK